MEIEEHLGNTSGRSHLCRHFPYLLRHPLRQGGGGL